MVASLALFSHNPQISCRVINFFKLFAIKFNLNKADFVAKNFNFMFFKNLCYVINAAYLN